MVDTTILHNAINIASLFIKERIHQLIAYIKTTALEANQKFNIMSDVLPTIVVMGTAVAGYIMLARRTWVPINQFGMSIIIFNSRHVARFMVWWLRERNQYKY